MRVKFLTDSASDILPAEAEAMGITVIPIQLTFGEESYADGVTITHSEFYQKLAACDALPTTSQISPAIYGDYYEELTADGNELIVVCLSSVLSGTYQNAVMAAEDFAGRVHVVDSLNATAGQRILVMRGLELAEQGCSAAEIAEVLNEEKKKLHVVAMIDTLEYLKKGGRISPTIAFAGGVLNLKPAVEVVDGAVVLAGTVRGHLKGCRRVRDMIEGHGGIDWEKPAALVYSCDDGLLRKFMVATPELWAGHDVPITSLGGTIGTHIGPNGYGVAFFGK